MLDPTPTGTGIPMQMTSVERWFEDLRAVWADKNATWPKKLWRTLTNSVIMLAFFVIVCVIALIVMRMKGTNCKPCKPCKVCPTTSETPTSTEI